MGSKSVKNRGQLWGGLLPQLIFFSGSFIFFTFFADYVLFFQEKQSLFIFSGDYFADTVRQPGSFLVYLGRLLTTFFYYPPAGALIISAAISIIILLISSIIKNLTGRRSFLIPFLFGTVLFILQSNYQFLLFNTLGILLQLCLFNLSLKYLKGYVSVIIFPFWYVVTGGFAWIFAFMYTIHLLAKSISKDWISIAALFISAGVFILIIKEYFVFQPVETLLLYPLSNEYAGSQFKLFIPVVCLITVLPLLLKINVKLPSRVSWLDHLGLTSVAALVLISISSIFRYEKAHKEYFAVEKLFCQNNYKDVIDYVSRHPTTNRLTIYLNNIALCETGVLNDRLFWFPQSPDGQSLFLKWEMLGEVLRRGGYAYYSAGMINEAHRWAFENMVMKGIAPEDVRMLIKTEIINGNYKMASKYISMLRQTIFYSKEARSYEELIRDPELIDSHPGFGNKRKEKIEHDFFSITDNPYINVGRAFSADTMNRKIFDYKMAYLMLAEEYDSIASSIPRIRNLSYKRIPVHLEEALLVYNLSKGGQVPDLGALSVDPQTEARFTQFLSLFRSYGNNLKEAQPFLQQKFGNTFWYYAFYH